MHNASFARDEPNKVVTSSPKNSGKKTADIESAGARLARRKLLFIRRRKLSDVCLVMAMIGILFMIVIIELNISKVKDGQSDKNLIFQSLKWTVCVSTVVLLGFLVWFHQVNIQIFMIDNGMSDWRLAISLSRLLLISLEIVACAIHPFPGLLVWQMTSQTQENMVQIDIILSITMFLRFFLIGRAIMLHSHVYQDVSAQSLGALNKIHFNFSFLLKSMMNLYAEYVLTIMIIFMFLCGSWSMRACESSNEGKQINFLDSMWLIAITFLTVGYGDIYPTSTCGRAVSILTGFFGVGCTSLVVAVLTNKLDFSRSELFVHNFVINIELEKQIKHAAANVMRECWLSYKYRKLNEQQRALKHERRMKQAIRQTHEIKDDQSQLSENSLTMVELHRAQNSIEKTVEATHSLTLAIHEYLKTTNGNN